VERGLGVVLRDGLWRRPDAAFGDGPFTAHLSFPFNSHTGARGNLGPAQEQARKMAVGGGVRRVQRQGLPKLCLGTAQLSGGWRGRHHRNIGSVPSVQECERFAAPSQQK
jgi:hypothetical protein